MRFLPYILALLLLLIPQISHGVVCLNLTPDVTGGPYNLLKPKTQACSWGTDTNTNWQYVNDNFASRTGTNTFTAAQNFTALVTMSSFKFTGGSPGAGLCITTTGDGTASWGSCGGGSSPWQTVSSNVQQVTPSNDVRIGTATTGAGAKLQVTGGVRISTSSSIGTNPGSGKLVVEDTSASSIQTAGGITTAAGALITATGKLSGLSSTFVSNTDASGLTGIGVLSLGNTFFYNSGVMINLQPSPDAATNQKFFTVKGLGGTPEYASIDREGDAVFATITGAVIDKGGTVYNIKNDVKCDGTTDDTAAVTAALVAGTGKTILIPSGCKPIVSGPTSGAKFKVKSKTTILCQDHTAGFRLTRRYCSGGTYPGAACTTIASPSAECLGSGNCVAETTSGDDANGQFAKTGGTSYTLFGTDPTESAPSEVAILGCGFDINGNDDYPRCANGTNAGRACETFCDAGSTNAGGICTVASCAGGCCGGASGCVGLTGVCVGGTNANQPCCYINGGAAGTCTNAADCPASTNDLTTGCINEPGKPSGPGKITPIDFSLATLADVENNFFNDHRQGDYEIRVGSYSIVKGNDGTRSNYTWPTVSGSAQFLGETYGNAACIGAAPCLITYTIGTGITAGTQSLLQYNTVRADIGISTTGGTVVLNRNTTLSRTGGTGISALGGTVQVTDNVLSYFYGRTSGTQQIPSTGIVVDTGNSYVHNNIIASTITAISAAGTSSLRFNRISNLSDTNAIGISTTGTTSIDGNTVGFSTTGSSAIGIKSTAASTIIANNILTSMNLAATSSSIGIQTTGSNATIVGNQIGASVSTGANIGIDSQGVGSSVGYNIVVGSATKGISVGSSSQVFNNSITGANVWPATPIGLWFVSQQNKAVGNQIVAQYCVRGDITNGFNNTFSSNRCFGGDGAQVRITSAGWKVHDNYLAWSTGALGVCTTGSSRGSPCRVVAASTDCAGGGTCYPDPVVWVGWGACNSSANCGTGEALQGNNAVHFQLTGNAFHSCGASCKVCQGGANIGLACNVDGNCPSSTCGSTASASQDHIRFADFGLRCNAQFSPATPLKSCTVATQTTDCAQSPTTTSTTISGGGGNHLCTPGSFDDGQITGNSMLNIGNANGDSIDISSQYLGGTPTAAADHINLNIQSNMFTAQIARGIVFPSDKAKHCNFNGMNNFAGTCTTDGDCGNCNGSGFNCGFGFGTCTSNACVGSCTPIMQYTGINGNNMGTVASKFVQFDWVFGNLTNNVPMDPGADTVQVLYLTRKEAGTMTQFDFVQVYVATAVDNAFRLAQANATKDAAGVLLDAPIDGATGKVAMAGITTCNVDASPAVVRGSRLKISGTNAGKLTVANDGEAAVAVANSATFTSASNPNYGCVSGQTCVRCLLVNLPQKTSASTLETVFVASPTSGPTYASFFPLMAGSPVLAPTEATPATNIFQWPAPAAMRFFGIACKTSIAVATCTKTYRPRIAGTAVTALNCPIAPGATSCGPIIADPTASGLAATAGQLLDLEDLYSGGTCTSGGGGTSSGAATCTLLYSIDAF